MNTLLIFGHGYCGRAVAEAVPGFNTVATTRSVGVGSGSGPVSRATTRPEESAGSAEGDDGSAVTLVPFDSAQQAIAVATHILVTVAPDAAGDPVLSRYAQALTDARELRWIGYLSSTVVYGDRDGAWVDEDTPPAPSQPRGQRRLDAELAWSRFAEKAAVDIIRLGGIYGPGRSAFDDLRAGTARRIVKPGHQFGRIHRDDIGRGVAAAMRQHRGPGRRVLNFVDDEPAESAAIVVEAARLMRVAPPPEVAFADASRSMSPMAKSFWAENRKVRSRETQRELGLRWLYPGFREGLAAIWREESGEGPTE